MRVGYPEGSDLVRDYVEGTGRARSFYEGWHGDPEAFGRKALEIDERFDRDRRARAAELMSAPSQLAREKRGRFVEEGGLVVTAGQQPGLFTGPLYTIYKALSATVLARHLEQSLGRPVLPLFWIASEDHDWAEVNHAWVVDLDNELRRVELARPSRDDDRPIFRVPLDDAVEVALETLVGHLPDTDFSPGYVELLRSRFQAGTTLSDAFRGILEDLLGDFGLLFADASDPALKEASREGLLAELDAAERHEALLKENADALEESGYPVQVPILEGGVNLFVEGPAGRERVYRDDASYHLRHSGLRLTSRELERRIRDDVRTVSPNVLLRPVIESRVFPVVSIVCGPGETGYFAQLGDLFRAHGLTPPVVKPRFSVTLLEPKVQKVLEKFSLELEELARPHHELAGELTREEVPDEVRRALGKLRGGIGQGAAELVKAVRDVDPTLKGPVEHARNVAFGELDGVEKKIVQALKKENEIALAQLDKAQLHAFPEGRPQERVLNVFYYLVRYGDELLPTLAALFDDRVGAGSLEAGSSA